MSWVQRHSEPSKFNVHERTDDRPVLKACMRGSRLGQTQQQWHQRLGIVNSLSIRNTAMILIGADRREHTKPML